MELKDVILSTLAEIDAPSANTPPQDTQHEQPPKQESIPKEVAPATSPSKEIVEESSVKSHDEKVFLENIRERMLVLFEGFQSPNNSQIEAKVDLTLNFLEYLLANVDDRLEILEALEKREKREKL